ncbi:sodium:proton antiporter [Rhodobacteraceae bacterium CCMM004]|nr:sodium:proton antiporter [Rhodobacteraceae bacterium CCMM004]
MTLPGPLDARDVYYLIAGAALLGLTLQPWLSGRRYVNLPLVYVLAGAFLGWVGLPAPLPMGGETELKLVEHVSELIVIVSLAGAGLAIDARHTWHDWQPVLRLILIAMPLSIAAVALMGLWALGLPLAAALLLAAALAPTDPVLARSVQVDGPGREETPMQIALTGEAGLNDGLAFPFVYLAISVAALGPAFGQWGLDWLTFDVAYRVIAGLVVGYLVGRAVSAFVFTIGDGRHGKGWNAVLTILGATALSYGVAEAVDGYGFLAVFAAARAGRDNSRGTDKEGYEKYVHHGAEQIESILLAILLLWFGLFLAQGALAGLRWQEVAVAVALIAAVRPAAGWLALRGYDCPRLQSGRVAFFGIRGMGSIFYIAYAQSHAQFDGIEAVWRVAAVTILLSVIVHGFAANYVLEDEDDPAHPYKADDEPQ